jgi:predicted SnoaL-like aldol condensation-catalyzing enzyme
MREYYENFHISGNHGNPQQYFTGDYCVRHEPGVKDGVGAFLHDVEQLMQHRTIDELKFLLGQGDFVFIAAKGTHEGEPSVYVDLYRVEDEKIVEHWGFPQKVPPQTELKNHNGMHRGSKPLFKRLFDIHQITCLARRLGFTGIGGICIATGA